MFNILRITTDFTKKDTFWPGEMRYHITALIVIICSCYLLDIIWRKRLNRKTNFSETNQTVIKEYLKVLLSTIVFLNGTVFLGETTGLLYLGDGFIDYILANVVLVPFLLLYYTLIRNDIVDKNYMQQKLQLEGLKSKQLETELDYLKAQYHPHFLFNALNTVYFQIDEENDVAKKTVELLSELLRYQLYGVNKIVSIREEIDFINNYISFQQLRISERLCLHMTVDPVLNDQLLHPLLFQPLLENAFKYVDGEYRIDIDIRMTDKGIRFTIENSISPQNKIYSNKNKGIGIENLKRRLSILYPDRYIFKTGKEENKFRACLIIEPEKDGY